ncbi:MAG: single-stranded-DNA-specific exonuclease RecJ [Patescibacteria group bacterium]|jgi:single-stranded-DNA-specific exonuclease
MNKIWHIKPKAREEFFEKFPEYGRIFSQLLYNRDLKEKEEVEYFLHAKYEDNFDPFIFRDMEAAVALAIKKIKERKKICIYGDYDADGVTASVLLSEILTTIKADCFVYIPERAGEGYGVNQEAIDKILNKGANLMITVDGGIRNKKEIEYAKSKGLEIIITDHHEPPDDEKDLPPCLIINPHNHGEKYPFKFLSGVSVAFKFARALLERSTLTAEQKKKILEKVMDLVAIGTVADCVCLTGENRLFLKKGLEVLNAGKRIGLKELVKKAKLDGKNLEAWNIGFQIAPRLNASSRMGSANNAFNLLSTKEKDVAEKEAEFLDERNQKRQKETELMVAEVEEQLKKQLAEKIIIGVCPKESKNWNEGVVGLVAGRLTEKYHKPTLVLTRNENDYKGSGRSIDEFNLFNAVEECSDLLLKHGGHKMACGFSLATSRLEEFSNKMRKIARRELEKASMEAKIEIDMEINLAEATRLLAREVLGLAPFGYYNSQPKFLSRNVLIKDIIFMGAESQHLKFRLGSADNIGAGDFWGLSFNRATEWADLKIGDIVDIVYQLEENEFNGKINLQLKIQDIKLS